MSIQKRFHLSMHKILPLSLVWILLLTSIRPAYSAPVVALETTSIAPGIITCLNLNDVVVAGQSVEGLGTIHPLLNISTTGNAVAIFEEDSTTVAYGAPNPSAEVGDSILNQGVGPNGGFSDIEKLHQYRFSFAPGVQANFFSIKLFDFGDYNPVQATEHKAELVAFNANDEIVDTDTLEFTSDAASNPTSGSAGNLQLTGDAFTALPQEPGNYTFSVNGQNITQLELQFSHNNSEETQSSDPNIGLAVLCFQTQGEINENLCVDFVAVEPGSSVEGLGTLHPDLNIATSGNAVAIQQGDDTAVAYGAPNASAGLGDSIVNNAIGSLGGFADEEKIHDYQFSFTPGYSVDFFAVKMLDYGDFNAAHAIEHSVSLVAYNDAEEIVSFSELNFTSDASANPTTGSAGDLQLTGDAVTALPQEPGNFTFSVSGNGITRLELQFSNDAGEESGVSDPNLGLSILCFIPENVDTPEIPTDSLCMDFAALPAGSSVEGLGVLHPALNISSTGNTVAIYENDATAVGYGAPNASAGVGESILNNGVGLLGGFVDLDKLHEYEFSFEAGSSVSSFSLKILDYGDFNAAHATEHTVSLVAYDSNDSVIATSELEFTSDNSVNPTMGSAGNLQFSGDAITAMPQDPGNFIFAVEGNGITHLSLEFTNNTGEGHQVSDPNFALAVLCFVPEEQTQPELDPPTAVLNLIRPKTSPEIGGKFLVEYACSETAPNLVSATINGYDVIDGQQVNLVIREEESPRIIDDVLVWLFAPEFSFDVTCADDNGNQVSTTVIPEFDIP